MWASSTTLPVNGGKLAAKAANPNNRDSAKPAIHAPALERPGRMVDDQNLTVGGVWAVSLAVNSAIGLFDQNAVIAHSMPGKVLSSVL